MSPEDLETLVLESADPWQLQQAFAPLDEAQRSKLSTAAQKLEKQLDDNKANAAASDRLKRHIAGRKGEVWNHWQSRENRNARLALFALAPLSVAKKPDTRVFHDEHVILERIMRDRRPEWLDDWIAFELEKQFPSVSFPLLRGWIREGVCAKPESDGYFRLFASHLMRTGSHVPSEKHAPPLSRQLLDDPDLLQDVDGIFRVETQAFNTESWLTRGAAADYESWPVALVKLAGEGHLDRAHLLRLALEGLRFDLKQNQLAGFHRFYLQMAPSDAELVAHQGDYAELLCHPVSHVAKFAIDMLARVERLGALDHDALLREVPIVLASGGKGNALAALKLVQRLIARDRQAPAPAALSALVEALRHSHADVQAKALDLLEANAAHLDAAQGEALGGMQGFVAASNRARLAALLAGTRGAAAPGSADGEQPAVDPIADSAPVEAFAYVPLAPGDGVMAPVLTGEARLEPIASLDALIDAVFHAVETVDSADEVERIVDAISRFGDQRPADFDKRVAPLLHRMANGRAGSNGIASSRIGIGAAVFDLVESWAMGTLRRSQRGKWHDDYPYEEAFAPMILHIWAITDRIVGGEGRPLLAAPTHTGGWIDPLAWVDRLQTLQQLDGLIASMDFRLSLLRLAPDGRAEALGKAATLALPLRRIATFALGGDASPEKADRKDHAAWITAARCRAPRKDWSAEFAALELDDRWADSLRPAVHGWTSSHKAWESQGTRWITPEMTFSVACAAGDTAEPGRPGALSKLVRSVAGNVATDWVDLPTAALALCKSSDSYWGGDLNTPWAARLLAHLWPQKADGAHMIAAARLAQRLDEDASGWTPSFGFLQGLFQKNRPWGEAGHLLLCLGLVGKDADAKGLAVDALVEGIDGRMFDPACFAHVMAQLCAGEWVKLARLGEALLQVVQISPLHAFAIGEALQAWLPRLNLAQRTAFSILEVLLEIRARTGRALNPAASAALADLKPKGKAAKLAGQLLAA